MATVTERGFTIIELMLFLAISGALFAALMIGVNINITQQRYRESVVSYSSLLQGQYSEVENTRNDRNNQWVCADDGTVSEQTNGGSSRGTTNCVILGRAVQILDGGTTVKTSSVVGHEPGDSTDSDTVTLSDYNPTINPFDEESSPIDWGSSLVATTPKHPASTAVILILRSPQDGLIRVFTSPGPLTETLSKLISSSDASAKLTNCVRSDSNVSPIQSVTINPRIAGPDGVSINGADSICK